MGSKRAMLSNGLGEAIQSEIRTTRRFVDLFTGSGAVAWFVATRWHVPVRACDLQEFAVSLAASVICRNEIGESTALVQQWLQDAKCVVETHPAYSIAVQLQGKLSLDALGSVVVDCRRLCETADSGPVFSAYGGYYFSPLQALWIDALRATLPEHPSSRRVALAALIQASSKCAASPGHTAQPFQPTGTAGPYLLESWAREVSELVAGNFALISTLSALCPGEAIVADANQVASTLLESDLAFVDPPYSSVQYSRFYHVLETVCRGIELDVEGTGRYPSITFRPQSQYSLVTKAASAIDHLFRSISSAGARAIVTFPAGESSNGLSGKRVTEMAAEYFRIEREVVTGRFSTLGGNRVIRAARHDSREVILTLSAR